MVASFRGWPVEAVEFFEGLEADNSKSYWTAHRPVYDGQVLAPMVALLAELTPEFGEGRVFRPYRDVRFSADKTPYKTYIAAHLPTGYVSLSSEALGVGSGLYQPGPEELARFRAAVADDRSGPGLEGIVAALKKKKVQVSAHEVLKRAPRGFPADHPRADLLRYKGITAWQDWPVGSWLGTASAKKRVIDFLHASAPLREWIATHVTG